MKKCSRLIIAVLTLTLLLSCVGNANGAALVLEESEFGVNKGDVTLKNQKNSSSKKNISMKVLCVSKKKIKIKFTNKGSQVFHYPLYFTLEKRVKGKWKKVKFKKRAVFTKTLCELKGNSSTTVKITWKPYFGKNLSKGKYRIKWVHNKVFRIK